ncbi:gluconate 2-dehydrogenase subunit 3 family protein [Tatumella citrea]|uniref:Gluconate 2-dehydrogenase n=1 Tax=Tatumella citrea TaxID=53336 RepID=A0A1Y0LJ75_TATCI|nr:gluconate 2-dehydrogenase subunit 3 family protein [Tatumella citrea]ARU93859.1 gluconate 2-dehydrogenase [Tatumella citrea]ARU97897.1 gluconate 2-dehydrogenase [Tatumella citrea]
MKRRRFLASLGVLLISTALKVKAKIISGGMPWVVHAVKPPQPVVAGEWQFFTPEEVAIIEAIADRIIPQDELSIGGKEAGCALFLDRQLAGDYGKAVSIYRLGPFIQNGLPEAGPQYKDVPAERYRLGLASVNEISQAKYNGKKFNEISEEQQDDLLGKIESGVLPLTGVDGKLFFDQLVINMREGFFADPLYGGNKDMAGWKMLGFPGAQYDFRDVIDKRGEELNIKPVSMVTNNDQS